MLKILARAKINLFLDVVGRRGDGYHDISTILQTVTLADELTFNATCGDGGVLYDQFPGKDQEDDLVRKALRLVREKSELADNVLIDVKKNIPVAAGLGGGSADAAAALTGVNEFCGIGAASGELRRMAALLGADVPFFLKGGTSLATGTGTAVTRLRDIPDCFVIIADPGLRISTRWAYKTLDAIGIPVRDGRAGIEVMKRALEEGDYTTVCGSVFNAFEQVIFGEYPQVERIKKIALAAGADAALMTGSGPAVFALAGDRAAADDIAAEMGALARSAQVYKTCQSGLEIVE